MYASPIYTTFITSSKCYSTLYLNSKLQNQSPSSESAAIFGTIKFGFTPFGRHVTYGSNLFNSKMCDTMELTSQITDENIHYISSYITTSYSNESFMNNTITFTSPLQEQLP